MNASGCGVTVKEYGHALAHDPAYADKARAHQRADARPERAAARAGRRALKRKLRRGAGAARWRSTRRARCSTASSCAAASRRDLRALGFDVQRGARAKATCAAARPAPTRCCSPSWPTQLRDRKLGAPAPLAAADHRLGQHRLHPAPAERHRDAGAALGRGARRGAGLTGPTVAIRSRRNDRESRRRLDRRPVAARAPRGPRRPASTRTPLMPGSRRVPSRRCRTPKSRR